MSQCDGCEPGWCERHKVEKTPKLVKLCGDESRPGYFAAWEGGYGPGQIKTGEPRKIHKPDPVCIHRGDVAGTAKCGCCGSQEVYQCNLYSLAMTRKLKPGFVPVELSDGSKLCVDMRYCNACDNFDLR